MTHKAAQCFRKEKNFGSNEAQILKYLKLKKGEKPFARYNLKTYVSH